MSTRKKIAVMCFFVLVWGTAPLLNRYYKQHRESVKPSDLYEVVYNQLSAFRSADYARAYSQASYGIHQKFKPQEFMNMIREDYAGIVDAEHVEFGIVRCRDRHALIQVFFTDRDGTVLPCIYSLVYENEAWKIDGARMLPRWPAGSRLGGVRA